MKDNIKNIKIENFKKFESLEIKNIGQVNLITGDNNVGKTSLLEALLFSENNLVWISYLHQILCHKSIHIHPSNRNSDENNVIWPEIFFLHYLINDIKKPLSIEYETSSITKSLIQLNYISIENLTPELLKLRVDNYDFKNLRDWVLFSKNKMPNELQWGYFDDYERNFKIGYWPFISFNVSYGTDLHGFVDTLQQKTSEFDTDNKERIIELMKIYIPDFKDYELKLFGNRLLIGIATESNKNFTSLTQQGDGVQKFFRYVVEILYAEKHGENRLMIDEIDTGIHYLMLPKLWKAIFELSEKTGIQIFATTHSLDCINKFVEAGGENEYIKDKIRLIELEEFVNKENKIKQIATTFDFDTLEFKLETETNVRGGDVWR